MKLLFENWRGFLSEGRKLERHTTLISRRVVDAIKDDEVKDAFNASGELEFQVDVGDIVQDLPNVRNLYVEMMAGDYVFAHAKYEFDLDATEEQRKTSDIIVNVILPAGYDDSVLSQLIPELKDSLRHELEHSTQPTDMLMKIQKQIPEGDVWKSLESAKSYYTDEAETKAHIAGFYKKAKMLKEPMAKVIDEELWNIYSTGLSRGYKEEDLDPIMGEIKELWYFYALQRYPHAEMEYER